MGSSTLVFYSFIVELEKALKNDLRSFEHGSQFQNSIENGIHKLR